MKLPKIKTLSENIRKVSYFKDPKTKQTYCVSQALVRPGNWVVVQIMPQSEVWPVFAYMKTEALGAGVLILILIASIVFANSILRRISRATSAADEIAQGILTSR
ncbi:MAG: hypothetical protein ACLUKN_10865 [Bacilli bacterium]